MDPDDKERERESWEKVRAEMLKIAKVLADNGVTREDVDRTLGPDQSSIPSSRA